MSETITGWHFAAADRRLANGDGREIVVGETLSVKGTLRACQNALHMSPLALTALQYAAGPLACRVELRGSPREKSDTPGVWYGRSRKCLAMADATEALGLFVVDTLIYRQPHLVTVFERAGFPTHAEAIRGLMIPIETLADAERVFEAARAAAWDAALYARSIIAGDKLAKKHRDHIEARWRVWQKGYALLCDVNGTLYVYSIDKPKAK